METKNQTTQAEGVGNDDLLGSVKFIAVYADDGPRGPCGQDMKTTSPQTRVYLFKTEKELSAWLKEQPNPRKSGRRNAKIEVCGGYYNGEIFQPNA